MTEDFAALALLSSCVAVVALIGWWLSLRWARQAGKRAQQESADVIEQLSNRLRASAGETRRLEANIRRQTREREAILAQHQEMVAQLQRTQLRFNETARMLTEAQAQNVGLEEELVALRAASDRPRVRRSRNAALGLE